MKQNVIQIIRELVGEDYLYFSSRLQIKLSPHKWPDTFWAVCVGPSDRIFLMDGDMKWHEMEETDINYGTVLPTLYQRVQFMQSQTKIA